MKHTLNNFKQDVRSMTKEEQEDLLKELKASKSFEYTKAIRGESSLDVRLIRRQIAILKTIMNE